MSQKSQFGWHNLSVVDKIVKVFIPISWYHYQNWFYYFPKIETSKKALLGFEIDLQKVITIAAFYSMFYIFLYFASNYDLVILLWNVHSYICTTTFFKCSLFRICAKSMFFAF